MTQPTTTCPRAGQRNEETPPRRPRSGDVDRIARPYDPMNLVISAFQEPSLAQARGQLTRAKPVTGSSTSRRDRQGRRDLHARAQPGGSVLGVDISAGMIGVAEKRFGDRPGSSSSSVTRSPADRGRQFDAATIAFGMRNLPDYRGAFADWPVPFAPAGRSSASRSPDRAACSPGRSSSGSIGSCRSSAGWSVRAAPYGYLVAASRAIRARTDRRDHARSRPRERHLARHVVGIVTLHVGTVPDRERAAARG